MWLMGSLGFFSANCKFLAVDMYYTEVGKSSFRVVIQTVI